MKLDPFEKAVVRAWSARVARGHDDSAEGIVTELKTMGFVVASGDVALAVLKLRACGQIPALEAEAS